MNYKQNEKINQVKESTLVVGIDIGSTTQYARAFDWRGIELGKVFTFSNSREGFESFKAWMQHLQDKYRKSDVIVGIEPTGHYWFDLGAYLEDEGILLVTVTPVLGEKAAHNGKVVYSLDFEVTPHQLRHTYITNLIHSSVDPKTVQYLAGHESSKITMDIYAKVKYNRPDELVKSMGGAFAQWDGVRS